LTDAPHTPPLHLATVDEAIDAMRERGMRLSTPRRLVLEALFAADGPVSAQQLSSELAIDITSIYRNLEVLERFGIIRHVHLAHGAGLYVLAGRQESEYLYCERCDTVIAVAVEELDPVRDLIKDQFGFQAHFTHFAIVGLCERCANRKRAPDTGHRPPDRSSRSSRVRAVSRRGRHPQAVSDRPAPAAWPRRP
jgi:Fur family ferric uptake transcriptional regulator